MMIQLVGGGAFQETAVVWTDASSITYGVVVESDDGNVIENACWMGHEDTSHINMAEDCAGH